MKLVKPYRTAAKQKKLDRLFKQLMTSDANTQKIRDRINLFLNTERLKFLPLGTDD